MEIVDDEAEKTTGRYAAAPCGCRLIHSEAGRSSVLARATTLRSNPPPLERSTPNYSIERRFLTMSRPDPEGCYAAEICGVLSSGVEL
jgi:hypothetical protein